MTEISGLTIKQVLALRCVLSTRTVEAAAKCAGVGKRTLETWLTQPVCQAALHEAKAAIVAGTTAELERLTTAATNELWRILEQPAEDKDRLRAVGLILSNALAYRERSDLIQKVEDLTNAINEISRGK